MNHPPQESASKLTDVQALRCGVILNGGRLAAWQLACLTDLLDLPGTSLELQVDFPSQPLPTGGLLGAAALKTVDLPKALGKVPKLSCAPKINGRGLCVLAETEVADIKRRHLDVLLHFGGPRLSGGVLTSATYGLWVFYFGDPAVYADGVPGWFELQRGDPTVQAQLLRVTAGVTGAVLRQGCFPATADSLTKTINRVYHGVSGWPRQVCRDIHQGCATYVTAPPATIAIRESRLPAGAEHFMAAMHLLGGKFKRLMATLFLAEEWNVGLVRRPLDSFLTDPEPRQVEWLGQPARGTFMADPFGIEHAGQRYIFCEDYDYTSRRGRITAGKLDDENGLKLTDVREVLAYGPHLSYPFMLEHAGEVYCIPEARTTRELELFRAVELPYRFEKVATLLSDVDAIDPSVIMYEGCFWLFFVSKDPEHNTELLNIYHSAELTGPWQPHANNPVKVDVRNTRPGGTPFIHEGVLYRPTQDCAATYGRRVVINRVSKLSSIEFAEEPVAEVDPPAGTPYSAGLHTLSALGDWTLIDAKRFVLVPDVFKRKMAALGRKLFKIKPR